MIDQDEIKMNIGTVQVSQDEIEVQIYKTECKNGENEREITFISKGILFNIIPTCL